MDEDTKRLVDMIGRDLADEDLQLILDLINELLRRREESPPSA